eukprot:Ihof_evm2s215 gene=Ihof_evmTU2s215
MGTIPGEDVQEVEISFRSGAKKLGTASNSAEPMEMDLIESIENAPNSPLYTMEHDDGDILI